MIRGQKVILDTDLAALYGVPTKRFNEQVKRNRARFPSDFMFRLTREEFDDLKSQIATSRSRGWGGRRSAPYAFTEHGAVMAASVLNSPRAVDMSILVVRAFVRLRGLVAAHRQLAERLDELERKYAVHDEHLAALLRTVRELMLPPEKPRKRIGFGSEEA